jgi:ribosome recycling factor
MYNEIINEKREELNKVIEHFKIEIGKIRTGRANPSLVEDLLVDYYGTKTPLKQMASINIPESRTIAIQPWDRGALALIEKAIKDSDLNLNAANDGIVVRINIPLLTEERRREMVKLLNQKAEEGRIGIRSVREDAWKEIQDKEKTGEISEDDKFKGKEKLQEVVDAYNKQIEEIRAKKETEMMTV